ncbi:hypothetical protein EEL48_13250 [Muribaculaceae bacterium Isolate-102 (HZI)]|nr:hypothetical protein EEL48_13250 [Muribaculaceae bacterium Isolate-102 (HZI)]
MCFDGFHKFSSIKTAILPWATPQHWQIINGEIESAITVHYINEGIDIGDVILQRH